jgi:hypothetical protein
MSSRKQTPNDQYTDEEAKRRTEVASRAAFNTPASVDMKTI